VTLAWLLRTIMRVSGRRPCGTYIQVWAHSLCEFPRASPRTALDLVSHWPSRTVGMVGFDVDNGVASLAYAVSTDAECQTSRSPSWASTTLLWLKTDFMGLGGEIREQWHSSYQTQRCVGPTNLQHPPEHCAAERHQCPEDIQDIIRRWLRRPTSPGRRAYTSDLAIASALSAHGIHVHPSDALTLTSNDTPALSDPTHQSLQAVLGFASHSGATHSPKQYVCSAKEEDITGRTQVHNNTELRSKRFDLSALNHHPSHAPRGAQVVHGVHKVVQYAHLRRLTQQ